MERLVRCWLIAVFLSAAANTLPSSAADEAPVPRPVDPLQAEGDRIVKERGRYFGFVTAVTAKSITISCPGYEEKTQEIGPAGGIVKTIIRNVPPLPPRTFKACEALENGGWSQKFGSSRSYGLLDVRIGDRVDIRCHQEKGVDICDDISIQRRPGGKVPAGNVEGFKWHDLCNAYQFLEERVIAVKLPKMFARIHH